MTNLQTLLSEHFPDFNFKFDYPLREQTYFKVGGPAEVYLELKQREEIIELVKFCFAQNIKLSILGGASNVIVADEGVSGLVLHLSNDQMQVVESTEKTNDNNDKVRFRAEAGCKMALLVARTLKENLAGLEYFLGVPGTLGGAVVNNAHYLKDLLDKYIDRVEVITPAGEVKWLSHDECDFAYDHSRFQTSKEVILQVDFLLGKGTPSLSQELVSQATLYRAKTQPLGMPSSGCIFRNVPNNENLKNLFPQFKDRDLVPAGFLIDQAGLKLKKVGDIMVSDKHAAFMVNVGQGTAADIKELIKQVKEVIKNKFNINLQEEVFYLS